jgi:hypothetical protein
MHPLKRSKLHGLPPSFDGICKRGARSGSGKKTVEKVFLVLSYEFFCQKISNFNFDNFLKFQFRLSRKVVYGNPGGIFETSEAQKKFLR